MNHIRLKNLDQMDSLHEIINSLDFLDEKTLKETLAYIIKVYVIDRDISYDGEIVEAQSSSDIQTTSPVKQQKSVTFTELLSDLKKNCSFSELNLFSIENNNAFITIEGRKMMIPRGNAIETPVHLPEKKKAPDPVKESPQDTPARFKNLEID